MRAALVLGVTACASKPSGCAVGQPRGVVAEKAKAKCLAQASVPTPPPSRGTLHPVVLYLDRSSSMQGFLDPAYPTRVKTDFRSVLDAILAGLRPSAVKSYGAGISEAAPTIGVLGRREFYQDRDTRMEEVVALIERDTALANTHMIVGDGRRGSPATADGQFVRLRVAAQSWIEHGGHFLVATSNAPFKTIESDPSGCRRGASITAEEQTCPIYLFAFISPGEELGVAAAVDDAFEHHFVWPAIAIPPQAINVWPTGPRTTLNVNAIWERSAQGFPIVRTGAPSRTSTYDGYRLGIADTASAKDRTLQHLLDEQSTQLMLESRRMAGDSLQSWGSAGTNGLVRPAQPPNAIEIGSLGNSPPLSIVRVSLVPMGEPRWLSLVQASDGNDGVRTYGINRLFEGFRQQAKQRLLSAIATLFVVSN